jgi:Stress up-regulated Nod 19
MVLFLNGQRVCTSVPTYGKGGDNNYETIKEMSKCTERIPIKKGDVLTMSSEYNLAKHPL